LSRHLVATPATAARIGTGDPSNSLGADTDLYVDRTDGGFWERQGGAYVALPMPGGKVVNGMHFVLPAGGTILDNKFASSDAQLGYRLLGDGSMFWGAGGSTPMDIVMARVAPGIIELGKADWSASAAFYAGPIWAFNTNNLNDPAFLASLWSDTGTRWMLTQGGGMYWNATPVVGPYAPSSFDTNLYRAAADTLQTDDNFFLRGGAGKYLAVFANLTDGFSRWLIQQGDGLMQWGPGSGPSDTNLYRQAAGILKTDGTFVSGANFQSLASGSGVAGLYVTNLASNGFLLAMRQGTDTTAWRLTVDANGVFNWGPGGSAATDVNLYRSAAGHIKTDQNLDVGGSLTLGTKPNWAVPAAGTTGQALVKNSNTDYDTKWAQAGSTVLIQEQTLGGGGQNVVVFSSIPTGYRQLKLIITRANSDQGSKQTCYMRFNSDAGGSSYANNQQGFRSEIPIGVLPGTGMPSTYTMCGQIEIPYHNIPSAFIVAIPNTIARTNNSGSASDIDVVNYSTYWQGAGAVPINRIDIFPASGNIQGGGRFALYGIL